MACSHAHSREFLKKIPFADSFYYFLPTLSLRALQHEEYAFDIADIRVNLKLKNFAFREASGEWHVIHSWQYLPVEWQGYYVPSLWFLEEQPADAEDDTLYNCTLGELL